MEESFTERPNGSGTYVEVTGAGVEDDQPKGNYHPHHPHHPNHPHHPHNSHGGGGGGAEETLYSVFHRFLSAILFPDHGTDPAPLLHRIKTSVAHNVPLLREAAGNTARNVLIWTRRGSPLRALLVISVSLFFFFFGHLYNVTKLVYYYCLSKVYLCYNKYRGYAMWNLNKRQIIKHIDGIHSTTKTPS